MNPSSELLCSWVRQHAVSRRESSVLLASGVTSNVYVNMKELSLWGKGLQVVSVALVEELLRLHAGASVSVAGVSVGGDPLVAGILMEAAQRGLDWRGLLVRKEAKSHGISEGRAVEGWESSRLDGPVWLVEDVVSSGASSIRAARQLISEGYNLVGILTVLDREMGGLQRVQDETGVATHSLLRLSQVF